MAEWHLHKIIHCEQATVKYTFTRTPTNSPSNTFSKSNMRVHQVERAETKSNQITFIGLVSSENYYRRPRIITSIT